MIDLVKKYLEENRYSNQKADFEDLFLSHPNYPSVFAITDSLDVLSIENVAIKVPKEQLPELPESFLALYKKEMVLVSKTNTSIRIESEKGKKQNLDFNEFLTDWNGVVIAIEPNSDTSIVSKKNDQKWFSYSLPFIVLIILSIALRNYSFNAVLALVTSVTGLIISVFIVQEKFGINNEMVSRFCNINPNTSCDSVIKSNKSDINKWIDFSDLPLLFFGISVLSIALQPESSSTVIGFLSLLSVPVIGYSIWIQKFQIKKWCVLCLAVSFIIVLQSLVFGFTTTSFIPVLSINFFEFLFSSVFITSAWLFVKPILEAKIKADKEVIEVKKFKRNYSIFNFLTKQIPVISGFDQLEGLRFGNSNAEVQLTLILSPSCGHCHKAFDEAFELVSKFPKHFFLQVLFNINPENNENPYKTVAENLLAINNLMPEKTEEAIVDWHIREIGLEKWKEKWTINVMDMKVSHQIHQQYDWCAKNEFNYTPVKLINGKLFPKEYQINELKYFLNDFLEERELAESISTEA